LEIVLGERLERDWYFHAAKDMRTITPHDADGFLLFLRESYADGTAGRTVKRAKQFFRAAVRAKIIGENPFEDVKPPSQANEERKFFVTLDVTQRVIDACPDHEWRLLFALSRYGGLGCPSEHSTLAWTDVDGERDRFRVDSPKTGVRWVPLFPELRRYFTEAFELAEPGAVRVIARYRDANSNLRTQLMRIIRRAGFEPWPNLFHNLRASRETELTADFPIHVVCEWIGNSALIAQKHYLQVTEEDFQRAAKSGAILTETALRKGVPQLAALTGTDSQALKKKPGKTRLFCRLLRRDARWRNTQVYPQGDSNPCLSLERAMS
jgi:site-specific recombinase XerD